MKDRVLSDGGRSRTPRIYSRRICVRPECIEGEITIYYNELNRSWLHRLTMNGFLQRHFGYSQPFWLFTHSHLRLSVFACTITPQSRSSA